MLFAHCVFFERRAANDETRTAIIMEEKKPEKPEVITFSEHEVLEIIGPAQACGGFSGSVM